MYFNAMDRNIEVLRTCGGEWRQRRLRYDWYKEAADYSSIDEAL